MAEKGSIDLLEQVSDSVLNYTIASTVIYLLLPISATSNDYGGCFEEARVGEQHDFFAVSCLPRVFSGGAWLAY